MPGRLWLVVRVLFGLVLGIVVLGWTVMSVFSTLVVPRSSSSRLLRTFTKAIIRAVRPVIRSLPSYTAKDRVMAVVGPASMILLFVIWLVLIVVGFGLITWWSSGRSFASALEVSGSSVFTLGVISLRSGGNEAIEFITAASGLLVIALEIAYLPTLYAAFTSREIEVSLLATRAGTPAWGPEVLARAHWLHTTAELPDLYRTWEGWAAAVAESHTNYPTLMWFRSPVPWRSWLTSFVAILDAAALHDALTPGAAPMQARTCLQLGIDCLRSLAGTLHVPFDPDPRPGDPLRLTYQEYLEGIERLQQVDFPFERTPEEAWPHFAGWRVNYEAIVDALTRLVMPPPAPWFVRRPELGRVQWPALVNRTPSDPEGAMVVKNRSPARRLVEES